MYDILKLERHLFQPNAVAHEIILHLIHKLSFLLSYVCFYFFIICQHVLTNFKTYFKYFNCNIIL